MNRDVEKIYYNQRILIDNHVINREPRCWQVSKVNAIDYRGVEIVTLAQSMFDEHKDYVELDENNEVIGLWADYYASAIEPTNQTEEPIETRHSVITYSGKMPGLKVGGSYKKFTVTFYDNDEVVDPINGTWKFEIDGEDCSSLLALLTTSDSDAVESNQIKVKFTGDDSNIGKVMKISHTTDSGIYSELEVEIVGL